MLALLMLARCAQGITTPDQTIQGSRRPDKPLSADLLVIGSPGPFPMVIQLHGLRHASGQMVAA
jgi:hypothetical protein